LQLVPSGIWFTSLAKRLLSRVDGYEVKGTVLGLAAELQSFAEPVQSTRDLQREALSASFETGDTHSACLIQLQYIINLLWTGEQLSVTREEISKAIATMKDFDHQLALLFVLLVQRSVDALVFGAEQGGEVSERIDEDGNAHQKKAL
jgi:hypothetical protein